MTCRCAMCGHKAADHGVGRRSYAAVGVVTSEHRTRGRVRRAERRRRRRVEARVWREVA
jgi:hypothetical protein